MIYVTKRCGICDGQHDVMIMINGKFHYRCKTCLRNKHKSNEVKFEGQGKKPQHKGNEKLTQADIERLMGMHSGRRDSKLVKVYK